MKKIPLFIPSKDEILVQKNANFFAWDDIIATDIEMVGIYAVG